MESLKRLFADSKPFVHVLVCVFAISSWVDINGMWVELPIFVTHLPEQWSLPSYITILSQIANIGPIIFFILAFLLARKTSIPKMTLDKVTSYAIMLVGVTATLLLAFLWQRTRYFLGEERSVALLALSFFLAVMDCTSSVAYVAFVSALKPVYLSSFFIGEGLSGLLPAMMALGQGAGDIVCKNGTSVQERNVSGVAVNVTSYFQYPVYLPPRFSVQLFFLLLSAMIGLSFAAFCLLNNLRHCTDQFVAAPATVQQETRYRESAGVSNPVCSGAEPTAARDQKDNALSEHDVQYLEADKRSAIQHSVSSSYGSTEEVLRSEASVAGGEDGEGAEGGGAEIPVSKILFMLALVVVVNFLITSFLLSIQTYSCLPYGIAIYNLVVTLSNIANPVACLISMFFAVQSLLVIVSLMTIGCTCAAYIIALAVMSPQPPLVDQAAGGPVAVLVWVGAAFFLTYTKVSVAGVLRRVGRRALLWYGAATQTGALIGAVTGFVLVNEVKMFKDASWC
ncbi:hypothetical protein ACOMHN_032113 [Nucella lapillus]